MTRLRSGALRLAGATVQRSCAAAGLRAAALAAIMIEGACLHRLSVGRRKISARAIGVHAYMHRTLRYLWRDCVRATLLLGDAARARQGRDLFGTTPDRSCRHNQF